MGIVNGDLDMKNRIILTVLAVFGFLSGCTQYGGDQSSLKQECLSTDWPHELSDLKPDPAVTYGKLKNGFRYVLMQNNEPRDRVSMYLRVGAGSLQETDAQQGAAHYLEHMMFNGTEHFKAGELIEYFQKNGMGFGNDVNAHTSYDETVYKLNLANGREQELREGLLVLGDYAFQARLTDEEIERERGVILSEMRARESASTRSRRANMEFTFSGTRYPERRVIGLEETISKMDLALLQSYYQTWYRPDNMILVAVGNFNPDLMSMLIKERFESFRAKNVPPECISIGTLDQREGDLEVFYYHNDEAGSTSVAIETLWHEDKDVDGVPARVKEVKRLLINQMVNLRLKKQIESGQSPYTSASYFGGKVFGDIRYETISANTEPENWEDTLLSTVTFLRQIKQFGFAGEEVERVKREVLSRLEANADTQDSRESTFLTRSILHHLTKKKVFMSPVQELELYSAILENIDVEQLNEAFINSWGERGVLIKLNGNVFEKGAEQKIKKIYERAKKVDINVWKAGGNKTFPYLTLPNKSGLKYTQSVDDQLDIKELTFSNGLRLTFKKTDFEKDEVDVRINFGRGSIGLSVPGIGTFAKTIVNNSGTATLQQSELDTALAGTTVSTRYSVGKLSSTWSGSAQSKDLEALFQVLYARISDPAVREGVFLNQQKRLEQMYRGMGNSLQGSLRLIMSRFLASGDKRVGMATWEELAAVDVDLVKRWYFSELEAGIIDVSVVGDFKEEILISLVEKYFGHLPVSSLKQSNIRGLEFPEGQYLTKNIDTKDEKSLLIISWPLVESWSIKTARQLDVLASLFEELIRQDVREKLGAVYSPSVFQMFSRKYDQYGYLNVYLQIEPGREQELLTHVQLLAAKLVEEGCGEELFHRVKMPILTELKDTVRTNNYWLNTVLSNSAVNPEQFQWAKDMRSSYEKMNVSEINNLSKRVFKGKRPAIIVMERGGIKD